MTGVSGKALLKAFDTLVEAYKTTIEAAKAVYQATVDITLVKRYFEKVPMLNDLDGTYKKISQNVYQDKYEEQYSLDDIIKTYELMERDNCFKDAGDVASKQIYNMFVSYMIKHYSSIK